MKILLISACLVLSACASPRNVVVAKVEPLHPAKVLPALEPATGPVCFFEDTPSLPHTVVGRVAATKKSYGAVDELTPVAAQYVRQAGGNAVFGWNAATKFKGGNPWRVTAPSGVGVAVRVTVPFVCSGLEK